MLPNAEVGSVKNIGPHLLIATSNSPPSNEWVSSYALKSTATHAGVP